MLPGTLYGGFVCLMLQQFVEPDGSLVVIRMGRFVPPEGKRESWLEIRSLPKGDLVLVRLPDGGELVVEGVESFALPEEGGGVIAYLLEGRCKVWYGDRLEHVMDVRAGEQGYIPADVPHAPFNDSGAPCIWIVTHSSGSDQDGIVLLPELDEVLASK